MYADTSLIVALLTDDAQTAAASTWLAQADPALVFSAWALTEFTSALNLQLRQGRMDEAGVRKAEALADELTSAPGAVAAVLPDDILDARNVLRRVGYLRAPDALHLVICRRLDVVMGSLDATLNRAADDLGVERARI